MRVTSYTCAWACVHYNPEFIQTGSSYLDDFAIEAVMPHSLTSLTCAKVYRAFGMGETRRITCSPDVVGSIIRIRCTGTKPHVLTLCEVKVYGTHGKTVILLIS